MVWAKISTIGPTRVYASAGSTTALATTATTITGLTLPLTVGTWDIRAWIPIVNVGAPTNTDIRVLASGALVTSASNYTVVRCTASAAATMAAVALNVSTGGAQISTILAVIEGMLVVTTAGSLIFNGTRTGGTSQTVQTYAYAESYRLA